MCGGGGEGDAFHDLVMAAPDQFPNLTIDNGFIRQGQATYVPFGELRTRALQEAHDTPVGGHFGRKKTYGQLKRSWWWRGISNDVRDYVRSCLTCARCKAIRDRPSGELQPLPTPNCPWGSVSMDFITDLPPSEGHTCLLGPVCRLSKMTPHPTRRPTIVSGNRRCLPTPRRPYPWPSG